MTKEEHLEKSKQRFISLYGYYTEAGFIQWIRSGGDKYRDREKVGELKKILPKCVKCGKKTKRRIISDMNHLVFLCKKCDILL